MTSRLSVAAAAHRGLVGSVVVVLALVLGFLVGLRSPWGATHAQARPGVAVRANSENDLVMFDADDGTQIGFRSNGVSWSSSSQHGEGAPPCLNVPLRKVRVEVGVIHLAGPDGGRQERAVWVRCP